MSCYLCDDCQNELDEALASVEATAVSGAIQRIDREKAKIIGWVAYRSGGDLDAVVDAVLDELPELMKGESDE